MLALRLIVVLSLCMLEPLALMPAEASEKSDVALCQSYSDAEESQASQFSNFVVADFRHHKKMATISKATVTVKLIQPINSSFVRGGEDIQAEVVSSSDQSGSPWIPAGTVLTGTIERSNDATYGRTDGSVAIRFYTAHACGESVDLNSAPSTSDAQLNAQKYHAKITTKQKIRSALLTATFIAVPLAIGSGGTSIAITAGAGAIIGGVLADDHKYLQGAIGGAWDGTPLRLLNPLVKKGRSVVIPAGTELALRLTEEARIPAVVVEAAKKQKKEEEQTEAITLNTQAKLIASKPLDMLAVTNQYNTLISQKDLASALSLLDKALKQAPESAQLQDMRQHVLEEVTGLSSNATTTADAAGHRGTD